MRIERMNTNFAKNQSIRDYYELFIGLPHSVFETLIPLINADCYCFLKIRVIREIRVFKKYCSSCF